MHWTPNSDAIPDCALRNRDEIMREKGERCDGALRAVGGAVRPSLDQVPYLTVYYLWLALHSRFLLQSPIVQWSRAQTNCCAPASQHSWEWHIQDVTSDPPLMRTVWENLTALVTASWASASHYIKLINTPAPTVFYVGRCGWHF